jgi:hypothetical protein
MAQDRIFIALNKALVKNVAKISSFKRFKEEQISYEAGSL